MTNSPWRESKVQKGEQCVEVCSLIIVGQMREKKMQKNDPEWYYTSAEFKEMLARIEF